MIAESMDGQVAQTIFAKKVTKKYTYIYKYKKKQY